MKRAFLLITTAASLGFAGAFGLSAAHKVAYQDSVPSVFAKVGTDRVEGIAIARRTVPLEAMPAQEAPSTPTIVARAPDAVKPVRGASGYPGVTDENPTAPADDNPITPSDDNPTTPERPDDRPDNDKDRPDAASKPVGDLEYFARPVFPIIPVPAPEKQSQNMEPSRGNIWVMGVFR